MIWEKIITMVLPNSIKSKEIKYIFFACCWMLKDRIREWSLMRFKCLQLHSNIIYDCVHQYQHHLSCIEWFEFDRNKALLGSIQTMIPHVAFQRCVIYIKSFCWHLKSWNLKHWFLRYWHFNMCIISQVPQISFHSMVTSEYIQSWYYTCM